MSNLSLHSSQNSRNNIEESSFLHNSHDTIEAPLSAPKSFFGRRIEFHTIVDHLYASLRYAEEAHELRHQFLFGSSHQEYLPQRIRALEGRANVHTILAREAEEGFFDQIGARFLPAEEERTLLPEQLPPSFFSRGKTTNFYNIKRKQRQQLAMAAIHDEKAVRCLREVQQKTKFLSLLKEHGDPEKVKKQRTTHSATPR